MTRATWGVVGGLLLVIGAYVIGCTVRKEQDQDRYTADSLRTVRMIDSLRLQTAKIDTIYAVDTVKFQVLRTRWDTLVQQLIRRDTLHDTLTVERIVQVADSTVKACSLALLDCQTRGRLLEGQRDSLAALLARVPKPKRIVCGPGVGVSPDIRTSPTTGISATGVVFAGCLWRVLAF